MNETVEAKYQRLIASLGQIPTMPTIVGKVMQIINDPLSSTEDASRLIEKDVALTSKVLRLANSAFYGIPRTISSVTSAVVILGFNTIRSLVLSATILRVFPMKPGQKAAFDRKAFWKHSVTTAIATRMVAKHYQKNEMMDLELAFCAGLLHDVGKVILDQFVHEEYAPVLEKARKEKRSVVDVENEMLGINHANVSGMLIDKWEMPRELKIPVGFHHNPFETHLHTEMAALVNYANYLAHKRGSSCIDEEAMPVFDEKIADFLKLGRDNEQLLKELEDQIASAQAFFNLVEGS